jgi:hypothetical protein
VRPFAGRIAALLQRNAATDMAHGADIPRERFFPDIFARMPRSFSQH